MITIYHNPNCGTSRNTLAMIRQRGEEFEIVRPSDPDRAIHRGEPERVRLCRPSEKVLEILPNPQVGRLTKEDGEVVGG